MREYGLGSRGRVGPRIAGGFTLEPAPHLSIRAAVHFLSAIETNDAVYGIDGQALVPGSTTIGEPEIGLIVDAELGYAYSSFATIVAGFSFFEPGGA